MKWTSKMRSWNVHKFWFLVTYFLLRKCQKNNRSSIKYRFRFTCRIPRYFEKVIFFSNQTVFKLFDLIKDIVLLLIALLHLIIFTFWDISIKDKFNCYYKKNFIISIFGKQHILLIPFLYLSLWWHIHHLQR